MGVGPIDVELEAGKKYAWCSCAKSKRQPFCDGGHKNSGMVPKIFSVDAPRNAFLCVCKKTGNPPYCDGTHGRA